MKLKDADRDLQKSIDKVFAAATDKISKVAEDLLVQTKKVEQEHKIFNKTMGHHDGLLIETRKEVKDVSTRVLAINDRVKEVNALVETNTLKLNDKIEKVHREVNSTIQNNLEKTQHDVSLIR